MIGCCPNLPKSSEKSNEFHSAIEDIREKMRYLDAFRLPLDAKTVYDIVQGVILYQWDRPSCSDARVSRNYSVVFDCSGIVVKTFRIKKIYHNHLAGNVLFSPLTLNVTKESGMEVVWYYVSGDLSFTFQETWV